MIRMWSALWYGRSVIQTLRSCFSAVSKPIIARTKYFLTRSIRSTSSPEQNFRFFLFSVWFLRYFRRNIIFFSSGRVRSNKLFSASQSAALSPNSDRLLCGPWRTNLRPLGLSTVEKRWGDLWLDRRMQVQAEKKNATASCAVVHFYTENTLKTQNFSLLNLPESGAMCSFACFLMKTLPSLTAIGCTKRINYNCWLGVGGLEFFEI